VINQVTGIKQNRIGLDVRSASPTCRHAFPLAGMTSGTIVITVEYTTVYRVQSSVGSWTYLRKKFRGVDFVFFLMVALPGIFLRLIVLPYEEGAVPEGRGEHVTGTLAGAASVSVCECERERIEMMSA
jgi:hypothetical protein